MFRRLKMRPCRDEARAEDRGDVMATPPMPPAGWYADPSGRHEYRYWDGTYWTAGVADGGITAADPLEDPPPPAQQATAGLSPARQATVGFSLTAQPAVSYTSRPSSFNRVCLRPSPMRAISPARI